MNLRILYVEDDKEQRSLLSNLLKKKNFNILEAEEPIQALEILNKQKVDIIISDFKMPNMDGYEFLNKAKKINPLIPFIIITAYGDIDLAVKSIKSGAIDFITKPVQVKELIQKIRTIEKNLFVQKEIETIENIEENNDLCFNDIIYKSETFKNILSKIPRIAKFNFPVLIIGESGTGKEIIANLIQSLSDRKDKPFIKVNCAAIPESLMESEFFGYEKGAFTGANKRTEGKIESASTGTIFLDEIGELAYNLQGKLLRFLQNGEIQKIGSTKVTNVDVKIISATNKNLKKLIDNNKFREDLFFRLNVINLELPPLRQRKEDIPLLVDCFMEKYSKTNNISKKSISSNALNKLMKYSFPGNIRELENIIQNAIIFSRTDIIEAEDIPIISDLDEEKILSIPDEAVSIKNYLENVEKKLIIKALKRNNWIRARAAKDLQISESLLRYKIKKYGIENAQNN